MGPGTRPWGGETRDKARYVATELFMNSAGNAERNRERLHQTGGEGEKERGREEERSIYVSHLEDALEEK